MRDLPGEFKIKIENKNEKENSPGRYLRLDLFIKVLSLLCPNLTDASSTDLATQTKERQEQETISVWPGLSIEAV